jgi:hypothetical protein
VSSFVAFKNTNLSSGGHPGSEESVDRHSESLSRIEEYITNSRQFCRHLGHSIAQGQVPPHEYLELVAAMAGAVPPDEFHEWFGERTSVKHVPAGRLYCIVRASSCSQSDIAAGLETEHIQTLIGLERPVSQATISRIVADVPPAAEESQEHVVETIDRLLSDIDSRGPLSALGRSGSANGPRTNQYEPERSDVLHLARQILGRAYSWIEFDRAQNYSISRRRILQYLELCAARRRTPAGLNTPAVDFADELPNESSVATHLRTVDQTTVTRMFGGAHAEVRDWVDAEFGTVDVALDTTPIDYWGEPGTAGSVRKNPLNNTVTKIEFLTVQLIGDVPNFVPVVFPVTSKSNRGRLGKRALRWVGSRYDVGRVLADSEFYSEEVVRGLREVADSFIVRAPNGDNGRDNNVFGNLRSEARSGTPPAAATTHGVGDLSLEDTLFVSELTKQSTRQKTDEDGFAFYYTDQIPQDTSCSELVADAQRRWQIETAYDQMKNTFMPPSGSSQSSVRYFHIQFGTLLYNVWRAIRWTLAQSSASAPPAAEKFLDTIASDPREFDLESSQRNPLPWTDVTSY